METIIALETYTDINQVQDFFSYEHFYVIYTHFWKLDTDHDLYISKEELSAYNNNELSSLARDRLFEGTVFHRSQRDGRMSYEDWVWFLLSEEDKTSATAIDYWFRIMDLDGDGIISMYEMEQFYEEQVNTICFSRVVISRGGIIFYTQCALHPPFDSGTALKPCLPIHFLLSIFFALFLMLSHRKTLMLSGKLSSLSAIELMFEICDNSQSSYLLLLSVRLGDIRRSGQAKYFFNTFLNAEKYLDFEEQGQYSSQEEDDSSQKKVRFSHRTGIQYCTPVSH